MNRETDPAKNNPIIKMIRLDAQLWDQYKGLNYACHADIDKRRQINKIEKTILEIESLMPKLKEEVSFLRSFHQIK